MGAIFNHQNQHKEPPQPCLHACYAARLYTQLGYHLCILVTTQVNQQRTLTKWLPATPTGANGFRSQRLSASLSSRKDSSEFSTNWWKLNTALAMTCHDRWLVETGRWLQVRMAMLRCPMIPSYRISYSNRTVCSVFFALMFCYALFGGSIWKWFKHVIIQCFWMTHVFG